MTIERTSSGSPSQGVPLSISETAVTADISVLIDGLSCRLLNISNSEVLIETTSRLQPGRSTTVVIVGADSKERRVDGHIIRTTLVSIAPSGELVFQTAVACAQELPLSIPETLQKAAHEPPLQSNQRIKLRPKARAKAPAPVPFHQQPGTAPSAEDESALMMQIAADVWSDTLTKLSQLSEQIGQLSRRFEGDDGVR